MDADTPVIMPEVGTPAATLVAVDSTVAVVVDFMVVVAAADFTVVADTAADIGN
jgi:hypothetical protein